MGTEASRCRCNSCSLSWAFLPFSSPDLLRLNNIPRLERRVGGLMVVRGSTVEGACRKGDRAGIGPAAYWEAATIGDFSAAVAVE